MYKTIEPQFSSERIMRDVEEQAGYIAVKNGNPDETYMKGMVTTEDKNHLKVFLNEAISAILKIAKDYTPSVNGDKFCLVMPSNYDTRLTQNIGILFGQFCYNYILKCWMHYLKIDEKEYEEKLSAKVIEIKTTLNRRLRLTPADIAGIAGTSTSWSDTRRDAVEKAAKEAVENIVGDIDDLTTTNKDTVVGAINEINGKQIVTDTTLSVQGAAADAKAVGDALVLKVEKVQGKGLSTNDYTNSDKQKVANAITSHQDISGKADVYWVTDFSRSKFNEIRSAVEAGKVIFTDFNDNILQMIPSFNYNDKSGHIQFMFSYQGGRRIGTATLYSTGLLDIENSATDISKYCTIDTNNDIDHTQINSILPWSDRYLFGNYPCNSLKVTDPDRVIFWYGWSDDFPNEVYVYGKTSIKIQEQYQESQAMLFIAKYTKADAPDWLKKIFGLDIRERLAALEAK